MRTALDLLEQKNAENEANLEALRREVMLGVEAYERGDFITINSDEELDAFFNDIHAEITAELADEAKG